MYFTVNVKVQHDNGNGKIKKVTERYLVDAMSVTEAEARVTEVMKEDLGSNDFEVVSASVSRIYKVIG
jgi:hypothetical protein